SSVVLSRAGLDIESLTKRSSFTKASSGCQAFPRPELCCLRPANGTMPGSDSLSVGFRPGRGGSLQFPTRLSLHSTSPYADGCLTVALPSASPLPWAFAPRHGARLPLFLANQVDLRRGRLRVILRTAGLLALLAMPCPAAFDG